MSASEAKSLPAIGFLTVVSLPDHGLVGGYLILNAGARPLEFHCTAPVKANRAQQILYGPTLAPYLYGEQIGQTLLAQAKSKPLLAVTDVHDVLEARRFTSLPMILVLSDRKCEAPPADPQGARIPGEDPRRPASLLNRPDTVEFSLGQQRVAVNYPFESDQQTVIGHWRIHMQGMDLQEPFGRIHEAIQEAQGNR